MDTVKCPMYHSYSEGPVTGVAVAEQHTLESDGEEIIAVYDFVMRAWTLEELHRHLAQPGFRTVAFFGDYDRSVPPGATDRLVSMASLP